MTLNLMVTILKKHLILYIYIYKIKNKNNEKAVLELEAN